MKNSRSLALLAVLGAGIAPMWATSSARAVNPTPAGAPATRPSTDDDEKRIKEIPHLRELRKQLEVIKADLEREAVDPKGYRHEAVHLVGQAIDKLNQEIVEYNGEAKADRAEEPKK